MPQRTLTEHEFNTIKSKVLSSAPDHLSEEDFTRWAGPVMAQAIGEAENSPAPLEGSALSRFVSNAAEMLNPVAAVQGLASAVQHPIDTVTNIGSAMVGEGRKAIDMAHQGRYVEAAGHGLASIIPVVGPAAAQAGEQIAQGDVAGGLGKATGLVAPAAVMPAVRGARAALGTAGREGLATSLEAGAARRVADVMAPKVGANKARFGQMADQVAPSLAKAPDGAAWSREGLHAQVQARLAEAEAGLDAAADARIGTRPIQTQPIIDDLMAKRKRLTAEAVEGSRVPPKRSNFTTSVEDPIFTKKTAVPLGEDVVPAPNAERVAQIDQAIKEIKALGPTTRYEPLRRIRQAYDGPAKAVYSPAVTADFLKAQGGKLGAADVTGTLRDVLATVDPETAAANADYSLYRKADDVLSATAEVERTRPKVGRAIMARLTGSLIGERAAGVPGAIGGFVLGPAMDAALSSGVTTKLQTAKYMTQLAEAIRSGNVSKVNFLSGKLKAAVRAAQLHQVTSPSGLQAQPAPASP